MRVFIIIVLLLLVVTSCNYQDSIEGHWRPIDNVLSTETNINDTPIFRDLVLNIDSTFIAVGLDQQATSKNGWHSGATEKGKWSLRDNILSLWIEGSSYPAKFKVLKISQHELEMQSLVGDFILRFSRIKDFG